ncbi:MAG: hypothetical protein J6562_08560 [Candidatus Schmidhempelia sp.]|nr:hypothetical protein [Candidatus Schmidhempelia sp.]
MTEDEQNEFVESILYKIDNKIELTTHDVNKLVSIKCAVEHNLVESNDSDFYTYSYVFKLKDRFISIEYEECTQDRRSEITKIWEVTEVKPIEVQVTVTKYVPIT